MTVAAASLLAFAVFSFAVPGSSILGEPERLKGPSAIEPMATPGVVAHATSASATDALIVGERATAAPEFSQGKWINSAPLSLAELKGRVVYIEFWTFGCFNCINTLPTVKGFDERFRDSGLTVIGIETPELDFERSFENLASAVRKRGIEYPVLTDYDSKNWEAYDVNAWPTIIIVDKTGRIRYRHVGEGAYAVQESVIKALLTE